MRDIVKELAPALLRAGFDGAGRTFRRSEGDFVFVISFDDAADGFYINLGAHPTFIPAEGSAELDAATLKEYECALRGRVGDKWKWTMSDREIAALDAELGVAHATFFAHAGSLPRAIETESAETLMDKFCRGTPPARAALHLARAGLALGQRAKAAKLARRGLELTGEHAKGLRSELRLALETATN
jgi:hypothetical protein